MARRPIPPDEAAPVPPVLPPAGTPPGAPPGESRPLVGILLVVLAVFLFALNDVTVKHLAQDFPIPLIGAVRYSVNLALLCAVYAPRHGRRLWRTERTWLVLLRGLVLALGTLTMGFALRRMPVGETVTIIYLAPFVVMLLAGPLLGERVTAFGWIAAAVGFLGVVLILRPGGGLDPIGVAWALLNVGLATAYHMLTRLLARTETTMALLFHVALVGAVFFWIVAAGGPAGAMPTATDAALMGFVGLTATVGHFLFTAAYREAPASLLAPVNFLHVVWAGLLGLAVFGHVPAALSVLGMALVCASGMAVALHAHLARRRAAGARA